ncbi:MAG: hypothetical protein FWE03_02885 [Firmicutes bacterium]|nr:hypothetical protein [Bacillota bacterium]
MIKKMFTGMKKWLIAIMVILFVVPVAFIISACQDPVCPDDCDTECVCTECDCEDGTCECHEE